MITLTVQCQDDAERLVVGQAVAFARQLRRVAADAPDGAVPPACERAALDGGRSLLRDAPAAALRGRIAAAEQQGGPPALVPARTPDGTRAGTGARS